MGVHRHAEREPDFSADSTQRTAAVAPGPAVGMADRLLALQRTAGNHAVAGLVMRQEAETRERERELGQTTSENRADGSWFKSDWAGRAILARYLSGAGDWDIANDPAWTAYMRANPSLKVKMAQHARYIIANTAALGYDEGVVYVGEQYPVEIETAKASSATSTCTVRTPTWAASRSPGGRECSRTRHPIRTR